MQNSSKHVLIPNSIESVGRLDFAMENRAEEQLEMDQYCLSLTGVCWMSYVLPCLITEAGTTLLTIYLK